jgi:hypothetical protein
LVTLLREDDQRVQALAAQALEHVGAEAAIAIPDLLRLLENPQEGLRSSACKQRRAALCPTRNRADRPRPLNDGAVTLEFAHVCAPDSTELLTL